MLRTSLILSMGFFGLRCASPPPASLLLITVDTLRADRLGAYGGPDGLTPRLDAHPGEYTILVDAMKVTEVAVAMQIGVFCPGAWASVDRGPFGDVGEHLESDGFWAIERAR